MPTVSLPRKFIERCQRYLEENPRAADNVADFITRCGRLGLWYLEKLTTEEERKHCGNPRKDNRRNHVNPLKNNETEKHRSEKVFVYIPDKDYAYVEKLVVEKLGITTTVISWYILCVFMVVMGYWELPPKI
jgi:hypothetical protein